MRGCWMASVGQLSPSDAGHSRPPESRNSQHRLTQWKLSRFSGLRVVHRSGIFFEGSIDFFPFASMSRHCPSSLTLASGCQQSSAQDTTKPRTIGWRKHPVLAMILFNKSRNIRPSKTGRDQELHFSKLHTLSGTSWNWWCCCIASKPGGLCCWLSVRFPQ